MKKLLSMLLCAVMTVTCIGAVPAHAASSDTRLRVGLTISGASTFAAPQLENVSGCKTGYTVGTVSGTAFSGSKSITSSALTVKLVNDAFQVSDTDSGSVLYTSAAGADHIAIRPNSTLTWFKGYKWYGDFVYRRASNGSITVINYVGVEDYVKGVMPYEIDPDWPAEAQKAQAVCARSFALGTHKHGSDYDLCNTTNCQVYLGANRATEASDAAVNATKGETLSYNGSSVIGYFYSSDGGATEDAANVWGGDYAYLKGKADPYEDPNKDKWTVTLTADEIQQKVNAAGYSIGKVANVQVTKRTATDNVNEVTVTDTSGKSVTISRSSVRTVFGLKSIRYTITPVGGSGNKTSLQVKASTHNVKVNGKTVSPQGYYIVNGTQYGNNYFKLRDIAYLLSGTKGQFNVRWDKESERILLTSGTAYETVGGELADSSTAVEKIGKSTSTIVLDGEKIALDGYIINGNNYYKLRDIGKAIGFDVDFDNASSTVLVKTTSDYSGDDEDANSGNSGNTGSNTTPTVTNPTSYTFNGSGWGHSVGMSQWGAYAMAQKGFTYDQILKFYFTGIEIAE